MKRIFSLGVILLIICGLIWVSCQKKVEEKVVKIGAILPLTGDAAKYGKSAKNGIDLAIEDINKKGGILGRQVKVIYEDSQADASKAVSAFRKIVNVEHIKFILGPLSSTEVLAVAPIANKEKVIILAPAASAPQITYAGDYIFRNVMSDLYDGWAMAAYVIKGMKKKTAAIFYINNDFGIGLKNSFKEQFEKMGGKVLLEISFERGEKDFRAQITKIKNVNPEVVFLVGQAEMAEILKEIKEMGIKLLIVSFSMFEDPDILKVAGDAAEGVVYTYRVFNPESENPVVKHFVERYEKKYGVKPDIFAGLSYDAARILALALERGEFKVEKVKEALYNIKNFPGVVGKTSFDKNGDVKKPIGIKKVENGKFIWVTKVFEF